MHSLMRGSVGKSETSEVILIVFHLVIVPPMGQDVNVFGHVQHLKESM
jgi:hypothetical protein